MIPQEYHSPHISVEVVCYANGTYAGPFIHINGKSSDDGESLTIDPSQFKKTMKTTEELLSFFDEFVKSKKKK